MYDVLLMYTTLKTLQCSASNENMTEYYGNGLGLRSTCYFFSPHTFVEAQYKGGRGVGDAIL